MTLHDRMQATGDRLTDADRRILEVLLSHPTESAFLSAAEITHRAGVHQASATKLAQRLGYAGYLDLRRGLQHDLLEGTTPAERVQRRLEQAGGGDLLASLVSDEVAVLRDLPRQVPQTSLDRAAHMLVEAPHRYLFAQGNATVLGDLMGRRLSRFGLLTTTLASSGRDLAEQMVSMGPGDVLVAFAFLRTPRHLPEVAAHCADVGARFLLVTDTLGAELGAEADIVLSGARGSGREFQSLTVPMAVTNALILTVARSAPELTGAALARLEKLLVRFDR